MPSTVTPTTGVEPYSRGRAIQFDNTDPSNSDILLRFRAEQMNCGLDRIPQGTSTVDIELPVAMADTNYFVFCNVEQGANFAGAVGVGPNYGVFLAVKDKTTTGFTVDFLASDASLVNAGATDDLPFTWCVRGGTPA